MILPLLTILSLIITFTTVTTAKNIQNCFYNTIDLRSNPSSDARYSASAAAGLLNRNGPMMFTIRGPDEQDWQNIILSPLCSTTKISPAAAITTALSQFPKIVLYDGVNEWNYTIPSVTTMAGVLDAIPMSNDLYESLSRANPDAFKSAIIVLNTTGMWKNIYEATNYTIANALPLTSGMSFNNPGELNTGVLADLIVGKKYFSHYLPNACEDKTPGNNMLQIIVKNSNWPRPIAVIGYNGQDALFGGDLFEAETDCANIHSMGQIASDQAQNLMFWSKFGPQFNASAPRGSATGPLKQPPPTGKTYDKSKTYVTLVYGDMDNLAFVLTFAKEHMQYRSQTCQQNKSRCFPFTWTMSPHLIDLAPDVLRWYFDTASKTGGLDTFILPPSGYLYAYPGGFLDKDLQATYVKKQNEVSNIMDTTGSIHWEWFFTWPRAYETYFPRYIGQYDDPTTKNFFLLSVPWPVPELLGRYEWWVGDKKNSSTNVFTLMKNFVWQKGGGGGRDLSPAQAAKLIDDMKLGSINYVYIIQNTPIQEVFEAVGNITNSNVELVSYNDLGELARQKAVLDGEK